MVTDPQALARAFTDAAAPPRDTAAGGAMGQLFTLALLAAGKNNCSCKSCLHLLKVIDEMEKATEGASSG